MKKVAILVSLILILAMASLASADINPGVTSSNTIILNMSSSNSAAINIVYYNANGSIAYTNSNVTINPGAVVEVKAQDEPLPAGFSGSAVVSSDQPIAAVTSLKNTSVPGAADSITQAAYNGASTASDTLFFPSAWGTAFQETVFTIQNTSGSAVTVSIQYTERDGTDAGSISANLAANGSRSFCLCNSTDVPAGFPSDFAGAIQASTSTPSLAGVAVTTWSNGRSAAYQALTSSNQGTTLYVPSQFRLNGTTDYILFSAINVQNTSTTQSAPVTIEYYNRSDGALAKTLTTTIAPGSAIGANTKNGGDFAASDFNSLGQSWDGSVKIISDNSIPLVGTGITSWGQNTYAGMAALPSNNDSAESLFIPAQYILDYGSGTVQQWSSLNLQNVSETNTIARTDLTVKYVDTNGNVVKTFTGNSLPFSLGPGGAIGFNTKNGGDLSASDFSSFGTNFIGGIIVEGPAGAELVATSNIIYNNRASVYNAATP